MKASPRHALPWPPPRLGRAQLLWLAPLLGCTPGGKVVVSPGETGLGRDSGLDTSRETGDPGLDSTDAGAETGAETSDDTGAWTLPPRPDVDAPASSASWRWGGGEGYPDVVDRTWPVVTPVADAAGLVAALGVATAGDVVWVDEGASIDVTGLGLCVPAGVWLAGGRGQPASAGGGAGGLLYVTEGSATPAVQACGADVRVTGLRLRGPDPETCPVEWPDACPEDVSGDPNCAYCTLTAYGIGTRYDGLEVDNNELSGWTYTAVGVRDAVGADVHHNHVHHGWREGLGYGVVVYGEAPTTALVRWNRFDAMRHVVAGQGYPAEDYEARDNLVETSAISHVFDMHGENEAADNGSSAAGGDVRIHRNIVLVPDHQSFVVRGRPTVGAWFYANCVAPDEADAVDQRYYSGNLWVATDPAGASAPNAYGQSASGCGTLRWCLRDGLVGPQRYGSASGTPAGDLLVGDLDGDGRDDVFGTDGSQWRWANPDGGTWSALATSSTGLDRLALADLDGDGVDDVFYGDGATWRWSRSGRESWATLRAASATTAEVRFGDFDGDGAADVFLTESGRWWYHPRGSGSAVGLASSSTAIGELAVGDFDGDGIADVFTATGTTWRWSRSGTASWADLATSSATLDALALADADGDGVTDVLAVSGETLRVSWGGRSSWVDLRHQREGLDALRLGDFDGDGRADALIGGCL